MKAGRELDKLLAEKVMGWQESATGYWINPGERNYASWAQDFDIPPFNPSADIGCAWEVVEKLSSQLGSGIKFRLGVYEFDEPPFTEGGERRIIPRRYDVEFGHRGIMSADTPAHAICLAALRAVEDEANK